MTRTYTAADAATLTLPADLLPGVLEGWTGPVERLDQFWPLSASEWDASAYGRGGMANGADHSHIRLPLARPEVQHRLCVVLAARGAPAWHLLPVALGGSLPDEHARAAPALLDAHARRVMVGMGGVRALVPNCVVDTDGVVVVPVVGGGSCGGWTRHASGGYRVRLHIGGADEERIYAIATEAEAAFDVAALSAGYALLDGDGTLRVEVPEGVPPGAE